MPSREIATVEDLMDLLDRLFAGDADREPRSAASRWDAFYADRGRAVPFFRPVPDESLVAWHRSGLLSPRPGARALDLGCGPGRNAVWLAGQGYEVDAVDLSSEAVEWARERASQAGVHVRFAVADVLAWPEGGYDLVHDSGCFHHLPPHRRISYRSLLERALAPGGAFTLACFAPGAPESGSELPDEDLYREGSLFGGLAYGEDDLRRLFGWLHEVELRPMQGRAQGDDTFGVPFLHVGLFRRRRDGEAAAP